MLALSGHNGPEHHVLAACSARTRAIHSMSEVGPIPHSFEAQTLAPTTEIRNSVGQALLDRILLLRGVGRVELRSP